MTKLRAFNLGMLGLYGMAFVCLPMPRTYLAGILIGAICGVWIAGNVSQILK